MEKDEKDSGFNIVKKSEKKSYSLSIILPVFNVEKYLERCIKSILEGTYNDLELIIVNDGSKDNSDDIIRRYIEKYNNITYIIKENGGLSHARNVGYLYTKGEYIAFFDSDDYIEKDMYKKLMGKVEKYKYDIVVSDLYMEYEETGRKVYVNSNILEEYRNLTNSKEDIEIRKEIMEKIYIAVHNKIYKKELLDFVFKDSTPFINNMYYEDIVYTYSLIPNITSISFVKEPLYNYVQRKSSISNNYDKKLYDIITSVEILVKNAIKNNIFEEYKDILEYIGIRYLYGTFMKRIAKTKDKKKYLEGYNIVLEEDKKLYEKYGILGKNKKHNIFINNNEKKQKKSINKKIDSYNINNNDNLKGKLRLRLKNFILKNMDKKIFAQILYLLEKDTEN